MCIFHKYKAVDKDEHTHCGRCFSTYGWCSHSIKICIKCGKFKGYGGHGELSVIPDSCMMQVVYMKEKYERG